MTTSLGNGLYRGNLSFYISALSAPECSPRVVTSRQYRVVSARVVTCKAAYNIEVSLIDQINTQVQSSQYPRFISDVNNQLTPT